jgi:hypothetical protein
VDRHLERLGVVDPAMRSLQEFIAESGTPVRVTLTESWRVSGALDGWAVGRVEQLVDGLTGAMRMFPEVMVPTRMLSGAGEPGWATAAGE